VEPSEAQLRWLYEILSYESKLQWRMRYIETLPGGEVVLSFEHGTNDIWRCLYTIQTNSEWNRREFYVEPN
jgi:hypothetical protein